MFSNSYTTVIKVYCYINCNKKIIISSIWDESKLITKEVTIEVVCP